MKTVALRGGTRRRGFDIAIGGARRDEERSRAKEKDLLAARAGASVEPRKQRPEFWRTVNSTLVEGQTMRCFPISNWTELDVWRYIDAEGLDVVPLYFSADRPVVMRNGVPIMVDDDRLPLEPGEEPEVRRVRFRTLGCYPSPVGSPMRPRRWPSWWPNWFGATFPNGRDA